MNSKRMIAAFCAAGLACGALAEEAKPAPAEAEESSELSWAPGDGVTYGETSVIKTEVGVAFDSRYMTYGVIDGKDPIVTPSATMTFFDWFYVGISSIFDVTKGNGKRGGYGNRAGKYTTIDSTVGLAHEFDLGDNIGTFGFDFNYIYEYIHRYSYLNDDGEREKGMDDTQYFNLELTLGGHWIEPTLWIERDLMADDGTYVNLSLAHEFPLIDGKGEDDDPILAFTPSIGQGLGNTQRARGYFWHKWTEEPLDHGGLMDTTIKGELAWNFAPGLSLTGYIAYSDYWLDSNMREGAREHNAAWGHGCNHSWNFYGGLALTATF